MRETMKAAIYAGKDALEVREIPVPEIGEGEALVKVKYAGICGTDLSILAGKHPRAKAPLVMGHELSGEIVEVHREGARGFASGDRVVAEPLISCGECFTCKSGYAYVCQRLGLYGIDAPGAFAEYVKLPTDKLFKIPDSVTDFVGALIEPVAVAVHANRMADIKVGDTVFVQGAGPIGLLAALVARTTGASQVLISEIEPFRVSLAREFGLRVVDLNEEDAVEAVNAATQGRGADVVFEAAGAPPSILQSPSLCRVRGQIIQVSMPKDPIPYDIVGMSFKEQTIKGVRVYAPFDFERAIAVVSETEHDLSKLLSDPIPLDRAAEAFAKAKEGKGVMRVVMKVDPQAE